jgi:hypothetical protein
VGDEVGHEAVSVRNRDRLGAAVHAELAEDALDVRGDGLRADEELVGDVALRVTFGEQAEHGQLAPGQSERLLIRPRLCSFPVPAVAGRPQRVATNAGDQLARVARLGDVVVRADQERGDAVVRAVAVS